MTGTIWDEVLGRIETKVNRYTYDTWFKQTTLSADRGDRLAVRVTDRLAVEWLTKHYTGVISEALIEVGRPGVSVELMPEALEPAGTATAHTATEKADAESSDREFPGLSPRYSFETFIVGSSNQFAHAACRAVAEAPSRSYNPLFLYGGVGLGKTH